jgi:hypothetical protein
VPTSNTFADAEPTTSTVDISRAIVPTIA